MIKYFTIEDLLKHYLQKKFHILMYHKGPYNQTYQAYPFMIDYAGKNHFEIESMIYDESLIDETTESDPANYITQISIKIKEVKGSD